MTVVVDASVVVAALIDTGSAGPWAEEILADGQVVAPHLLPAEVTNVLRRSTLAGQVSPEVASLAHADLLEWPIALFPYSPFAGRIWDLRENLTAYDAWYVALAEQLSVPLATLDLRLAGSPEPRCTFSTPPR
jgi:predicted nucleic acid-binding protein